MARKELAAPCGLYCGCCFIYKAGSDKALAQQIAAKFGMKAEQVKCEGCVPEKGACKMLFKGGICPTYECAVNRKKVTFCYECDEFPCLKLAPCADRAGEIPHNTKIYNLVQIQKKGLDKWMEGVEVSWKQYFQGKKPRGGSEIQMP